jgi:hypothetical protein
LLLTAHRDKKAALRFVADRKLRNYLALKNRKAALITYNRSAAGGEMTKRHTKLSILLCFLLFLFRVAPCIAQAGPGSAWCVVGGCNGELCTEQNRTVRTPCRYSPTFACYRNARCERQANGQCSWTITPQLRQCLNQNSSALEGIPDTSPAPSPAISLGAAYEVKCKDNLEHNMLAHGAYCVTNAANRLICLART